MPRRAQSVGPSKVVTRCYKGIRQQLPRRAAAADTEIPASDASNASDAFALHLAQPQRFRKRHCKSTASAVQDCLLKTRQNKADETQQYRTVIPASDASNASDVQDYGRDPRFGCMECFGSARLWKTGQKEDGRNTSRATTEIPASDVSNASEGQDYMEDKT
jgi:hypothetical protein